MDSLGTPLADRVIVALAQSATDFRTTESLARQLNCSTRDIDEAMIELDEVVRRPHGHEKSLADWHRLVSRGKTWQERLHLIMVYIGGTRIDG